MTSYKLLVVSDDLEL